MKFRRLLNGAQKKIKKIGNLAVGVTGRKVEAAIDCVVDFKKSLHQVSKEGGIRLSVGQRETVRRTCRCYRHRARSGMADLER